MTNLEIALKYGAAGIAVFPTSTNRKPLPKGAWLDAATTDERQIRSWWQQHPHALIALPLKPIDLVVIDADRHVAHEDGVALLRELIAKHGELPPHPWCTTPRNGEHHY